MIKEFNVGDIFVEVFSIDGVHREVESYTNEDNITVHLVLVTDAKGRYLYYTYDDNFGKQNSTAKVTKQTARNWIKDKVWKHYPIIINNPANK